MANFTIDSTTIKRVKNLILRTYLNEGEKLSDNATLLNVATKTVPSGKAVRVEVIINITDIYDTPFTTKPPDEAYQS